MRQPHQDSSAVSLHVDRLAPDRPNAIEVAQMPSCHRLLGSQAHAVRRFPVVTVEVRLDCWYASALSARHGVIARRGQKLSKRLPRAGTVIRVPARGGLTFSRYLQG